jgi:type I restriction enzyme R subunit
MSHNEATARIKINKLLEQAGWWLLDCEEGEANVLLENKAKLTRKTLDDFGADFENSTNGFIDFLLVSKEGKALAVLEAKSEEKNPLTGKEQAREYAESINCRFVILSNGLSHYFWDLKLGNPEEITTFPTQDALAAYFFFNPDIDALINEPVDENFIAETQFANFRSNPDYINEATRSVFLRDNKIKQLRHYQVSAVKAIQKAVVAGKRKFLFEMATGTGKTLTSAAIIKLFLKTENAKKVLFIVDRLELENQASEDLKGHLRNSGYNISIFKENKDNWRRSDIVISTVQSFNNDKYRKEFKPDDFDLIISDEAHRSITGNYRAVFEYFVGYKLGLTATPKNYLKNFKDPSPNDERELETRTLLDTYKTFGCEGGEPTFRYGLLDGVKDNVLINPRVIEIETEITTQLLSEEGYAAIIENAEDSLDGDEKHEEKFGKRDFEVRFFSPSTNREFCKIFLQKALKDPITGEIGKTIVFCVRQSHAAKITQILNEMAHEIWPNKYNSDFAVQITSDVQAAQDKTTQFKNNNLSGNANFNPEYKTAKTRVCVTVGMMTTGYDCADLLNICLMRPVFSPSEFVQIKGRGTRRHNFSADLFNQAQKEEHADKDKQVFLLFDYFATCKYFEEEFDYEEVIKLPAKALSPQPLDVSGSQYVISESSEVMPFTNLSNDEVKSIREIYIGNEGMRVDRMFLNFENKILTDPFIVQKVSEGDFAAVEAYIEQQYIDKPTEFFTVEGLNKSLKHVAPNLGRKISLQEFVKKAFGIIPEYKSKHAISDEAYAHFAQGFEPQDGIKPENIAYFYKALLENQSIREKIAQKDLAFLHGGFAESSILTLEQFKAIPADVRTAIIQHIHQHPEYTDILNQPPKG